MTPDEVRFHILQRLQNSPQMSQRELARELGVSLGKVNYCLRALVDKGFIKAGNFRRSANKAAYFYKLTPAGIEEKWRQTRAFLRIKEQEFIVLQSEIERLNAELAHADNTKAQ